MTLLNESVILSNENISAVVEKIRECYHKTAGKRAKNEVKLALSVEEILLNFRANYGTETPCKVLMKKSLGNILVIFKQKGPHQNPLKADDNDEVVLQILSNMGVIPKYNYESLSGTNAVSMVAEQKSMKNSASTILTAVLLAVVCFLLMKLFPENVQLMLAESVISPVFTKLTAIITAVATPVVFFAVVNGIAEIGDVRALGAIGKKFLLELLITYLLAGAAFTIPAAVTYGVENTSAAGGGFIKDTVQLVLDIFPDNLIYAFTIDNDLQVVVIAIFLGIVLLKLKEKAAPVNDAMNIIGEVVNQMMTIVFRILPAIVFMGVLNILCSRLKGLEKLWIVVVLFLGASALVLLYVTLRVTIKQKVPFKVILKKIMPTAMINLTTSSQVSALPENMKCCLEHFGIQKKLVDFGLPLGIVIYMPCGACFIGLTVWALADLAAIPVSLFQLILIFAMAIIIAIAAPPIPGSALTVLPIAMSVCKIPADFYPVGIILGTVLGYFLPLLNGYCLQMHMLTVADELQMVDPEVLKKPLSE